MARRLRVSSAGVPEHLIQRGNNRQATFACEEDMQAYVGWLKGYSKKYKVSVHAWVLMTNHVHILCTPNSNDGISQMMQSLGRMYVMYFNRSYKRTGTLWEGRFQSCLVQEETYLMQVYRYIEMNPVRASRVDEPADYFWSSCQCNALGKKSDLLTLKWSSKSVHKQEFFMPPILLQPVSYNCCSCVHVLYCNASRYN
jgi:putative transposase